MQKNKLPFPDWLVGCVGGLAVFASLFLGLAIVTRLGSLPTEIICYHGYYPPEYQYALKTLFDPLFDPRVIQWGLLSPAWLLGLDNPWGYCGGENCLKPFSSIVAWLVSGVPFMIAGSIIASVRQKMRRKHWGVLLLALVAYVEFSTALAYFWSAYCWFSD